MKKEPRRVTRAKVGIRDTLTRHAMRISGAQAKCAVRNQRSIRRLRGSVAWEGNLEAWRLRRATK